MKRRFQLLWDEDVDPPKPRPNANGDVFAEDATFEISAETAARINAHVDHHVSQFPLPVVIGDQVVGRIMNFDRSESREVRPVHQLGELPLMEFGPTDTSMSVSMRISNQHVGLDALERAVREPIRTHLAQYDQELAARVEQAVVSDRRMAHDHETDERFIDMTMVLLDAPAGGEATKLDPGRSPLGILDGVPSRSPCLLTLRRGHSLRAHL